MMKQRLSVLALFGLVCGLALVKGEQKLIGTWPAWVGNCVDSQGRDQHSNIGVLGLNTRAACLAYCKRVPLATGCEFDSSEWCWAHTKPVSGGSGTSGSTCNVFELRFVNEGFGIPAFEGGEPREGNIGLWEDTSGNCLNSEGKYQETGTIRVGERTSSPDSCLSICKRVPSAVGCEFQNFNNGSCTIHTKPVIGGEETSATCYVWKKALILG
eukprot:TRINITY_DN1402_c0_g1_i6.p1 TRINITY_DN1402_c0_g1~~TRINITY_DN1402_c0_g1_i6.p1  ORF type:complete len:213 (-),score=11.53 TRINITY_DN1402_c0_g1_i6:128-766(-)